MDDQAELEQSIARVEAAIERTMTTMEHWTADACSQLGRTEAAFPAADGAWRAVAARRRWGLLTVHSQVEQRFLRMMIRLLWAAHPEGSAMAPRIARYLSDNYAFEWLRTPITVQPRAEAAALIPRAEDSEPGSLPQAGPVAFALFHYKQLRVANPSKYADVYTAAIGLQRDGYFADRGGTERESLGLKDVLVRLNQLLPRGGQG